MEIISEDNIITLTDEIMSRTPNTLENMIFQSQTTKQKNTQIMEKLYQTYGQKIYQYIKK